MGISSVGGLIPRSSSVDEDLCLAAEFDVDLTFSDIGYQAYAKIGVGNLVADLKAGGRRVVLRRAIRNNGSC